MKAILVVKVFGNEVDAYVFDGEQPLSSLFCFSQDAIDEWSFYISPLEKLEEKIEDYVKDYNQRNPIQIEDYQLLEIKKKPFKSHKKENENEKNEYC